MVLHLLLQVEAEVSETVLCLKFLTRLLVLLKQLAGLPASVSYVTVFCSFIFASSIIALDGLLRLP